MKPAVCRTARRSFLLYERRTLAAMEGSSVLHSLNKQFSRIKAREEIIFVNTCNAQSPPELGKGINKEKERKR